MWKTKALAPSAAQKCQHGGKLLVGPCPPRSLALSRQGPCWSCLCFTLCIVCVWVGVHVARTGIHYFRNGFLQIFVLCSTSVTLVSMTTAVGTRRAVHGQNCSHSNTVTLVTAAGCCCFYGGIQCPAETQISG